jgi:protein-tyrosine phosphatase
MRKIHFVEGPHEPLSERGQLVRANQSFATRGRAVRPPRRFAQFLVHWFLLLALCATGCRHYPADTLPLPRPVEARQVELERQPNFRDLGGYKTSDGRTVKWGLLYRSGALSKLTDADLEKLRARKIATIIDFRAEVEVEKAPDRLPGGVRSLHLPVGSDTNINALNLAIKAGDLSGFEEGYLVEANRKFVREFTSAYQELLKQLDDPAHRPLLWHCTLGKDRAGLGAAIVLLVLGVPEKDVMEDYLLSNQYRAQEMRREMADFKRKQNTPLEEGKAKRNEQVFQALIEARREYLQAALDEIIKEYGSWEAYVRKGLAVNKRQQKRLQRQLLE